MTRSLATAPSTPDAAALAAVGIDASAVERYRMAHDASHYLLVPQGVATPSSVDEVRALFGQLRAAGGHLAFRSGGTSLSGQAVTDGVLVDTRRNFRGIEVLDGGRLLRAEPGATLRYANGKLARYGRKLGPDPASEVACTIGGVVANNSSGMACGTEFNSYRTLDSVELVLASGTVIDTGAADADERLHQLEPEIYAGLLQLAERVRSNPHSVETIRHQFSMKNTMGYSVNALLDFDSPVDILAHLMVGSEGTLGFVASATFRTIERLPQMTTGLAVFPDLHAATEALPELVASGFATIELMDSRSLIVAQGLHDVPKEIAKLQVTGQAALLLEFHGATSEELREQQHAARGVLKGLDLVEQLSFTEDADERASLWHTRKGLHTSVAGARPSGTTALLEDVVVPVERLAAACQGLGELFEQYGYEESVIFGHAKDGNVHFMLNERFDDAKLLRRYEDFTESMVDLILGAGGSLKAEHGTGRIMAPYVRRQYGDELYDVMKEIKRLLDPQGILNPGAVLSDDPRSYLQDLKLVPTVEEEVDSCVECGYCEPACPSKDLTLTPRQRITLRRDMIAAEERGDTELLEELEKAYEYTGVDTCAADGMCQVACPVNINTGDLVRRLRKERNGDKLLDKGWATAARHWDGLTRIASVGLNIADAMPAALPKLATTVGRALLGSEVVPSYDELLPGGGGKRRPIAAEEPAAVFFSACVGTMFGPEDDGEGGSAQAFLKLCERAGVEVTVPEGIGSFCCGTPWKSKGLKTGYDHMVETVIPALWEASRHGELPIVCDASSCTEGLEELLHAAERAGGVYAGLRFLDVLQFVGDQLLDRLEVTEPVESIVLHPTCSTERRHVSQQLTAIAGRLSDEVVIPDDWGCCAFAGDRGMLHPELTASAAEREAAEVNGRDFAVYASANRTCEIGMTRATGHEYVHIVETLERATRPVVGASQE